MNELENSENRMPYALSDLQFDAMRERIRTRTTNREKLSATPFLRPGLIAVTLAAVAVAVVAGVYFAAQEPEKSLEQLLVTAPDETLQHAAAENYDDILFNQQL